MRALLFLLPLTLFASGFPDPTNSETQPGEPMPAAEAAAGTLMPPGFKIGVFAAEPVVQNPIDCSWDTRGRMWVAENFTYERLGSALRDDFRDRVILLKDSTGDGRADQRLVFAADLLNLTSIEWTPQGLWLMCPPQLLFIPDENRDAVPDGPPQVILDGFTVPEGNHHNFANGLRIGPDGWLYGRCGGSAPGEVGKPGTPDADRIPLRGGIWRYHRTRGTFEVIASGTTNPWGHDWDENGNLFLINTVNDHLFHAVPGMRLARKMTHPANPRVYETIAGHADHWHFDTKGEWHESRDGVANDLGGGHAHVGMMIYQGTNWPAEYRGRLFTLNLHGRRINQEILTPKGSGFVASHGDDLFINPDPFFRGVELTRGPHGEVYVLDWSDTGECHENTGVHRTSGRIYMITYGKYRNWDGDLESPGVATKPNMWETRIAEEKTGFMIPRGPFESFDEATVLHDLRCVTNHWPLDTIESERKDIAVAVDETKNFIRVLSMLGEHSSPKIRLTLASTLQRLPFALRKDLAIALVSHSEDAHDPNLPLLVWYGLIPVAEEHSGHLVEIFAACTWPKLRQFIARRLAEDLDTRPEPLNALLNLENGAPTSVGPGARTDLITGMSQALAGWITAEAPPAWPAFSRSLKTQDPAVLAKLRELDSLFGDGRSPAEIEALALDPDAAVDARQAAVRSLIRARPENLKPVLLSLLDVPHLNTTAATGLAAFDDPEVARVLILKLGKFHSTQQDTIFGILCSRPAFARVLLDHIEGGQFPATRLNAFHARQLDSLGDEALSARLRMIRGTGGLTDPSKSELIEATRAKLTPAVLARADLDAGRRIFQSRCAACHKLHGQGGDIGPDLTGGGRGDLDYLLHNIIDPSAELAADFRMEIFTLADGRTLTGVVEEQSPRTLTLQTLTDREAIERTSIRTRKVIESSLMPDGLLNGLDDDETRDLFGYLMHPGPADK